MKLHGRMRKEYSAKLTPEKLAEITIKGKVDEKLVRGKLGDTEKKDYDN
jgi:hypothetical protein